MKKIKVSITSDCILCGNCFATLPEVFEYVDGNYKPKVEYIEGIEVEDELYNRIKEVAEMCPAMAIIVETES